MDFCFQIWPVAGPSGYILASSQHAGVTEHTKAKGNPYVSCCFFKINLITREWRRLHNEELHILYTSANIMRVIESRRLRWAGCSACSVLVGKPEGRRPVGRPSRRWKDNIKVDLREVGWGGHGLDQCGLG